MGTRLERILVPVDFGDAAVAALRLAVTWADAAGARVDLLHVIDAPAYLSPQVSVAYGEGGNITTFDEVVREEAIGQLDELVKKLPTGLRTGIDVEVVRGDPLTAIVERAKADDLVIVGTHAKAGLGRWMLGTLADKLMRSVDGPVVTVHESDEARLPEKIVVAVDGSAGSRAALLEAAYFHQVFKSEITTVHVVAEPAGLGVEGLFVIGQDASERTSFEHFARAHAEQEILPFVREVLTDIPSTDTVEIGAPADVIPAAAESADLVMMGTRGRTGLERFALGSVATRITRTAPCPVLTIRRSAR